MALKEYWLDPEYKKTEARRYALIDQERAAGRVAGCIECNRRDAHPDIGVCWRCAKKLAKETAAMGLNIDNPYRKERPAP